MIFFFFFFIFFTIALRSLHIEEWLQLLVRL